MLDTTMNTMKSFPYMRGRLYRTVQRNCRENGVLRYGVKFFFKSHVCFIMTFAMLQFMFEYKMYIGLIGNSGASLGYQPLLISHIPSV